MILDRPPPLRLPIRPEWGVAMAEDDQGEISPGRPIGLIRIEVVGAGVVHFGPAHSWDRGIPQVEGGVLRLLCGDRHSVDPRSSTLVGRNQRPLVRSRDRRNHVVG